MSNKIFFDLELREKLSKALDRLLPESRRVFGGIDRDVAGTRKKLNDLGGTEFKLRVDTSEVDRAGRKIDELRNKRVGGNPLGLGSIVGGTMLGGLAANALSGVAGTVAGF